MKVPSNGKQGMVGKLHDLLGFRERPGRSNERTDIDTCTGELRSHGPCTLLRHTNDILETQHVYSILQSKRVGLLYMAE